MHASDRQLSKIIHRIGINKSSTFSNEDDPVQSIGIKCRDVVSSWQRCVIGMAITSNNSANIADVSRLRFSCHQNDKLQLFVYFEND